jgi:predicted MFS family arabinose efflux permease
LANLLFYFGSNIYFTALGEEKSTLLSYIPRILGVLIAGFLISLFSGYALLSFAILSMCLMVIGFSIFTTANSVLLFKAIPKGFEGTYLGVNSSMVGMGVFAGALTAGVVTVHWNYTATFVTSSVILVASIVLFRFYLNHRLSEKAMS